jgi:hypothetical protein
MTADWDDETKAFIRYTADESWTWADLDAARMYVKALLAASDREIGIIADLRRSRVLPTDMLLKARDIAESQHPNAGITVFVVSDGVLKALARVFALAYPAAAAKYRFAFADDLDEARAILRQQRGVGQKRTDTE